MAHKILVIDDDNLNLVLVKNILLKAGYEVIIANDGDVGLEMLKTEKPDLIILDVKMPKMSGYEFMTELKEMRTFDSIPVVMLTAHESMHDIFEIEGVKAYFVKPLDSEKLINKIVECLGQNTQ